MKGSNGENFLILGILFTFLLYSLIVQKPLLNSLSSLVLFGYLVEDCSGKRKGRLPTHLIIVERAIELLKAKDDAELYSEAYMRHLNKYDHQSVLLGGYNYGSLSGMAESCNGCALIKGGKDEDDRGRAYNHFYNGEDSGKGLPWHDYFNNRFLPAKKPSRGNFYSALEWALGTSDVRVNASKVDESAFPNNWIGALEIYGESDDQQRVAYERFGHILHLLGDMAQPDHARLEPHPGSGCTFPVRVAVALYDATVGAGAGALAGAAVGTGVAIAQPKGDVGKGALIGAGIGAVVGTGVGLAVGGVEAAVTTAYERLINDEWDELDASSGMPEIVPSPSTLEKADSLEDCFEGMAKQSVSASNGFENPLGLDKINSVVVFAGLPVTGAALGAGVGALAGGGEGALIGAGIGAVAGGAGAVLLTDGLPTGEDIALKPTITSGKREKYFGLARQLIPESVFRCASLLKLFVDIVRPPPYVKSIKVIQNAPGGRMEYSATVESNIETVQLEESVKGKSRTVKKVNGRTLRSASPPTPFSSGLPLTVNIEFGPDATRIQESSLKVQIAGNQLEGDFSDGRHWEGKLEASKVSVKGDPKEIPIEIYAEDALPHYQGDSGSPRTESGSKLDTDPTTEAKVGVDPPYDWSGYESGDQEDWYDRNHKITIASSGKITVKVHSKKSGKH